MRKREAREMEAKALCPATPTKVVKASAVVLANPMARPSPMRECTRMAQRMAMLPVFIAARSMKSFMRACSFCASTSADAAGPGKVARMAVTLQFTSWCWKMMRSTKKTIRKPTVAMTGARGYWALRVRESWASMASMSTWVRPTARKTPPLEVARSLAPVRPEAPGGRGELGEGGRVIGTGVRRLARLLRQVRAVERLRLWVWQWEGVGGHERAVHGESGVSAGGEGAAVRQGHRGRHRARQEQEEHAEHEDAHGREDE